MNKWELIEKQIENLEEEMIGTPNKKVLKVLNWLYDNQMLSFSGKTLTNYFEKKTKR